MIDLRVSPLARRLQISSAISSEKIVGLPMTCEAGITLGRCCEFSSKIFSDLS